MKQTLEWNHTSAMLAQIHNILSKHPRPPDYFHPLKSDGKPKRSSMSMGEFVRSVKDMEGQNA